MFWMRGTPRNPYALHGEIRWDRGTVTGEPVLVADVQRHAAEMDGHAVGPEQGPYTRHHHLEDPLSAYVLMLDLFDRRTVQVGGDVPHVPPLPPGGR